jgi:molybdopterin-guanine dinucleotide biosynthesis protein A
MTRPAVPPSFEVVILAGGRATRLGGADKPGLAVGTSTLAAAAVSAAVTAGAQRVILVGPARPELLPLAGGLPGGLAVVREDPPASGPVPALRCGLASVHEPWTAVLAADLPFLRGDHLRALLRAAARQPRTSDSRARGAVADAGPGTQATPGGTRMPGPAGAVLVDGESRPQWLAGCWRTERLRSALLAYPGASLHGLMLPLRPVLVHCDVAAGEPPPWLDCDTAADLDRARQLLDRRAGRPGGTA